MREQTSWFRKEALTLKNERDGMKEAHLNYKESQLLLTEENNALEEALANS